MAALGALGLLACGQILGVTSWVDVGGSADGGNDGASGHDGSFDAGTEGAGSNDGGPASEGGGGPEASGTDTGADASPCHSPVSGGMDGVYVENEFCIDSTETPVSLYTAFLNAPGVDPSSGQPPECGWNSSYQPLYNAYGGDPEGNEKPITAIDWCDALAFCTHWGKRLCGNRTDGGAVDPTGPIQDSEWYEACSGGVGNAYPYGASYQAGVCRTGLASNAGAGVVPTATCIGGFPGLYDMSGNLQEFENSCTPGTTGDAGDDSCVNRGGTFFFPTDSVECSSNSGGALGPRNNNDTSATTIRCCWTP